MLAFITSSFWIKVVGFFPPPSVCLLILNETIFAVVPYYVTLLDTLRRAKVCLKPHAFVSHSLTVNTIIRSHLSVDLFAYNVYSLFLLFSNLKAASASNAVSYLPA